MFMFALLMNFDNPLTVIDVSTFFAVIFQTFTLMVNCTLTLTTIHSFYFAGYLESSEEEEYGKQLFRC